MKQDHDFSEPVAVQAPSRRHGQLFKLLNQQSAAQKVTSKRPNRAEKSLTTEDAAQFKALAFASFDRPLPL